MRRALAVLLTASLGVAPAAATPGERLQAYFAGLATLSADFRQTVTDADGRVVERAEGTLAISRPGRFRWDYSVPEQLIVADGANVWLYDVGLEQVTVKPSASALAGTPALLLAGQSDVTKDFDVSEGGRHDGLDWSLLAPRGEEGDFSAVRLGFGGGELSRMELSDRLGQTTRIEFLNLRRNPTLAPGLFRFKPPPGVDVVGTPAR